MASQSESRPTFDVVDPASAEVFASARECDRSELDAVFARAESAFGEWSAEENGRREAMRKAADAVEGAVAEIAPLLTREQGKPIAEAESEVRGSAAWLRYYADLENADRVIQDDAGAHVKVRRRPLGVVAAIASWNYPVLIAAWKIAPALRAGNTVVVKASPFTPLATERMVELIAASAPLGVLATVTGGDAIGAWMTNHPVPRKVSFTGSIDSGKRVAAAAAPDLKRLTLELGGNDAAIVLDDADPQQVAERIFAAAFRNNGQICSAIKRVYVAADLHDELVEALADRARAAKVGNGLDPETELGPVNNPAQLARVKDLVVDALRSGGEAIAGGAEIDRPGYFYAPTIVTGVAEGVRLVDEEQFGPVLPVMPFGRTEEALQRANSTKFGLCGSVWSADPDRAAAAAARLDCGTAWVNTHLAVAPRQPFGGHKWSGIGVEHGPEGLASFTEIQTLHVAR